MELNHTHSSNLSLSLPNLAPSSIHCSRFKPWINSKISINKHFEGLAELWRFHILQMLKPYLQSSNKHHSPHVIKGAQTLNSILRKYGVSINLIAAGHKNTRDVDLLFKYQLLNMPTLSLADNQLIKKSGFSSVHQEEGPRGTVRIFDRNSEEKPLIMLTAHGLPHAKSTSYFLVLVPLIAFCITCIVGALRSKDKGCEELDGSKRHQRRPKSVRWKHALSDIREPDILDSESRIDHYSASEDHDEILSEDTSHAYSKVENDYQKFLSECGISECGYWRGGIRQ